MARRSGRPTTVRYSTLVFASRIGAELYERISGGEPTITDLLGEWLFSTSKAPGGSDYISAVLLERSNLRRTSAKTDARRLGALADDVLKVKALVPEFVESEADAIANLQPCLIGFTSVFQQTMASIALATAIKRRLPRIPIVFGGANCEEPMGSTLLRHYHCIDVVVSGEGEEDFMRLLKSKALARDLQSSGRRADGVDLDEQPPPDHSDYFDQLSAHRFDFVPHLLYEASRGCWWGERTHCVFCGLNGGSMKFRMKSPAKVAVELREMVSAHPGCPVEFVDNILGMSYFDTLLPQLATVSLGVPIFFETKANLKWRHLEALRAAGVETIQPGIESLSDSVLRLMGKGVAAIQNIYLMRSCRELGIRPCWNWLWGFPGEDPAEYERLAGFIPLLEHLEPPVGAGMLRMDRYSPLFERAQTFGIYDVKPYPAYAHIYGGLTTQELSSVAYYFTFKSKAVRDVADYTRPVDRAIGSWRRRFATSELLAVDYDDRLWIWDTRSTARRLLTILEGLEKDLYELCYEPRPIDGIDRLVRYGSGTAVAEALEKLLADGLLIAVGRSILSLALRFQYYQPDDQKLRALALRIAQEPSAAFPFQVR
jgi:ribosomal peptide maturation radical SAM protein 1